MKQQYDFSDIFYLPMIQPEYRFDWFNILFGHQSLAFLKHLLEKNFSCPVVYLVMLEIHVMSSSCLVCLVVLNYTQKGNWHLYILSVGFSQY